MSSSLQELVSRAQTLYDDTDFKAVDDWKVANPGAKAIGFMPIYVPRELIDAAGMLPVGLRGAGGQLEVIKGDAYFQSYICQIPRTTIELALTGRLDSIDGFLFPAICDVIRNLSGMWKILFPEKLTRYLDVPQNFSPEIGGKFYRNELAELRGDLEKLKGSPITDDDIRASIRRYQDNRNAIEELMKLRADKPWCTPAAENYLIIRAGDLMPVAEHTEFLRAYIKAASESDRPVRDHTRVAVLGSFCEQPPLGLIKALERAGCYIVWDDMTLGSRWIEGPISDEGDPLKALSDAFIHHSTANASKYEPEGNKGQHLCDRVKETGAKGVLFAAPSFCDPALLDQPMIQNRLDKEEIPWTAFKYAENLGQFQVIREQAGTFADSIRLWSDA